MELGFRFCDIPELTLPQVVILTRAVNRSTAGERSRFITDMGLVVSSVLGGSDSLQEHLESLSAVIEEDT